MSPGVGGSCLWLPVLAMSWDSCLLCWCLCRAHTDPTGALEGSVCPECPGVPVAGGNGQKSTLSPGRRGLPFCRGRKPGAHGLRPMCWPLALA